MGLSSAARHHGREPELALGTDDRASSFGSLAGDLLVGNFGDGKINAFNLSTNTLDGQLTAGGQPLVINGLWALTVGGGGGMNGSAQTVYFTAGPNDESAGLFGALSVVPEPASVLLLSLGLAAVGGLAWQRRHVG